MRCEMLYYLCKPNVVVQNLSNGNPTSDRLPSSFHLLILDRLLKVNVIDICAETKFILVCNRNVLPTSSTYLRPSSPALHKDLRVVILCK